MSTAVEVRYQEAVIALADELNYTRAANRLHITQSALTKQIRELEKTQNLHLFHRDKKGVALTAVPPSLTGSSLSAAPLYAVLNEDDPIGQNDSVAIRDLGGRCWAVFAKKVHPLVYDRLFGVVKRERISIKEVQHILTAEEALPLVAEQDYVSFVTESTARRTQQPGVVFRPLRDEEMLLHTSLLMRADNESRLINSFVRAYLRSFQRKVPQSNRPRVKTQVHLRPSHS